MTAGTPHDPLPLTSTTWELLASRNFGVYFWGNVAASLGVWGYNVAAAVVAFGVTGSALYVGLVTVVQFTMPVVLAPVGGLIADRYDRRMLLISTQTLSALAVAVLAGAYVSAGPGGLDVVWPLLAVSFVLGLALGVTDPARHALVPALVAPQDVGQTVALNSLTFNIGRAGGPAAAGLLLAFGGPAAVFGGTALAYAVAAVSLTVIRPRPAERPAGKDRRISAGVRYVLRHRPVLAALIGVGTAAFGSDPVITLTPLLASDLVGDGSGLFDVRSTELAVGLLASAFGVGGVSTMLFLRRVHGRYGYRPVGTAGLVLLAAMLSLLALTAPSLGLGLSCLLLACAGVGYFLAMTSWTTLLQMSIPDFLRGRVMALWGVFFLGSRPLAAFIDSSVAELFSARVAMGTAATVVVLSAYLVGRASAPLDVTDGR